MVSSFIGMSQAFNSRMTASRSCGGVIWKAQIILTNDDADMGAVHRFPNAPHREVVHRAPEANAPIQSRRSLA